MLRRISKNVAALDAFPKVEVENQERSEKGGILTMVLTIVLILLTLGELREYVCIRLTMPQFHFCSKPKFLIHTLMPHA